MNPTRSNVARPTGSIAATIVCLAVLVASSSPGHAGPAGMVVQSGSASLSASGNQLNITASHNAVLNWQSFNIAPNETVRFLQPSASSVAWNRINDSNPSKIYGALEANGVVVLMNPSGFYFGPGAFVSAAGLIVSTAPATPLESNAGLFWQFNGAPPQAAIVNYGQLNAGPGGSLFLIGEHIENHGTLSAPEGSVGLLAGQEVLLSSRPDGRGLSTSVKLPTGSVDNSGRIQADAGTIAVHAQVVNQNGLVQANSVRERNGIIELIASESITLGAPSTISARGDNSSVTDSGSILIKSEGSFSDSPSSHIDVRGGLLGGNGGTVEISAPTMAAIHSTIDGQASPGWRGGHLVIDPLNITIGNSGTGSTSAGTVAAGDPPSTGTLTLDANSAFIGFSQISLQALNNISVSPGTTWDLSASTGVNEFGSQLKLEAGNTITIANGASVVAGENWSITLQAGRNFAAPDRITSGVGNITLAGSASLQAENGLIELQAGNNISVASGFVRTLGGGAISGNAAAGSITTGIKANGFRFLPSGTIVDADLGGISTASGGNVTLKAGLDVISFLPVPSGILTDGGSGAFGSAPGDVTINAGRDVAGHFVAMNGVGKITAGRDAGTSTRLLALSLSRGGWTVAAGHNILLQEVRNPNGIFNNLGSSTSLNRHRFDYAPDAYTILQAGNSVQLRGTALPRYNDVFEQGISPIYPGRLEISAGSGGVILGNDVTLFPSPAGNLIVNTTDGGSLVGSKPGDLTQLIVSDSEKKQYRAFGDFGVSDHAATPGHLHDTEAVRLNLSGDMGAILLGTPKRTEVNIGGNMINSRFDGQNLQDGDITSIHVIGNIVNRNEFTTVPLTTVPNFELFDLIYPQLPGASAGIQNNFTYNPMTRELTFQGRLTGEALQALLNLRIRTFDGNGLPVVDANGDPVTVPAEFAGAEALQKLYTDSQNVPLNPDTGYRLGGGGIFDIQARNLDLGATVGIVSQGPRANPALAKLFTHGSDINVRLSGDLDMFSTKIVSLNGGAINVVADGTVNVGSRTFSVSDSAARGIFTTDPSDVTVIARGDINVNGSRIAAYDGGNVIVRSLEGNVDAGTGGNGAATVEKIFVDPIKREILSYAPTIPGSGVLATTFPRSLDPVFPKSENTVGNILVETPRGNILASAGGVVQIPLNGVGNNLGTVTLRAGSKDAAGNVLHAGNIDASGSGVIGSNVKIEATGDIKGVIFARENLDVKAQQNVNVTALAGGTAAVGGGGTVSGTIIGVGSVAVSGATVDASLLSQNVSASGDVSSAQTGFTQGTAAASTSQSQQNGDQAKTIANAKTNDEDDEKKSKPRDLPVLARTVGRVTVILPNPK